MTAWSKLAIIITEVATKNAVSVSDIVLDLEQILLEPGIHTGSFCPPS